MAAVVYAPQLSHEIGRQAWWGGPECANARRLLEKADVAAGPLGQELADYLLGFCRLKNSRWMWWIRCACVCGAS
ncbi:MAG: hypothetical protein R3E89_14380 [Thiolinea sp.]